MDTDLCVECSKTVTGEQEAVECDNCERSTHRRCNTGWHTRINADIGKANCAFYVLVPALQREAQLVELTVRLITEEQRLRNQRVRYRDLEGKLHNFWKQYQEQEITASQLLRHCGGIYGPSDD